MLTLRRKIVKSLPLSLQKKLPKKTAVVEVNVRESRRLNRIYRDKDSAADVLSFHYGRDYGEILICPATIRRAAKEQGHSYKYQMTWMILHGMLHLAGMHHEKSKRMARRTEFLEREILRRLFKS